MEYTKNLRETYKWCNFWWDNAEKEGKRVLLVGDSISCGYKSVVIDALKGEFFVDLMGTSEFIADPAYIKELRYFLTEYSYEAIHFNNGLHGIGLDNDDYESAYREFVKEMLGYCKKIIITASTPITCEDPGMLHSDNKTVLIRNAAVKRIADEFGLAFDDLYSAVVNRPDLKSGDGYHFKGDGYVILGRQVADSIRKVQLL